MKRTPKVTLIPDCYELTARKNAVIRHGEYKGELLTGDELGYIEHEKGWVVYLVHGDDDPQGSFRSPYVAVAKIVAHFGLDLNQVKKPVAARLLVKVGRKIIGDLESYGKDGWTAHLYSDNGANTYAENQTKSVALRLLLKVYREARS